MLLSSTLQQVAGERKAAQLPEYVDNPDRARREALGGWSIAAGLMQHWK